MQKNDSLEITILKGLTTALFSFNKPASKKGLPYDTWVL